MIRGAWVPGPGFQKQDVGRADASFPAESSPVKVHARSPTLYLEELSNQRFLRWNPPNSELRPWDHLTYSPVVHSHLPCDILPWEIAFPRCQTMMSIVTSGLTW